MFQSGLPPDTVRDGGFFDVEANFRLRWLRMGLQQGAELLADLPQRHIVNQQRFVYLGQASENGRMGELLKAEMLKWCDCGNRQERLRFTIQ
jgi:hypothetical protein